MDEETRRAAIKLQTLATRLLRLARSTAGDHGLGSAQFSAMGVLQDRGPLSLVELARAEHVTHPTMSRVAAGLVKRGIVERIPDPNDKRVHRLALTPDGVTLYEKIAANRIAVTAAILSQLSKPTVAELLDVVARVAGPIEDKLHRD